MGWQARQCLTAQTGCDLATLECIIPGTINHISEATASTRHCSAVEIEHATVTSTVKIDVN